VTLTFEEWTQV